MCAAIICACTQTMLHAQEGANPLFLGRQSVPDLLGIVGGPSFHTMLGSYESGCPCTFEGGAGNGIALGINYDKNLLTYGTATKGQLWLGARLMFETRGVSAVFREFENVTVRSLSMQEQSFTVPIQFRHLAQLQFSLLTLTPYLQWNPFGRVFVQAGVQGGVVIGSRITHTKELLDRTVRLPTGERADVEFTATSGSIVTIEDRPVQRLNAFQLAFTTTAGIDIPINFSKVEDNPRYRLTPMLNYVIPLTTMSESGSNFRIAAFQILVALKMNLE